MCLQDAQYEQIVNVSLDEYRNRLYDYSSSNLVHWSINYWSQVQAEYQDESGMVHVFDTFTSDTFNTHLFDKFAHLNTVLSIFEPP